MSPSQPPQPSEQELLKSLLPPLLEDFDYWFARSRNLLENERITFLSEPQQTDLLARIHLAQQEVTTAKILFAATNGEVGIATATLIPWHHLLGECWQVSRQWRQAQAIALKNPANSP